LEINFNVLEGEVLTKVEETTDVSGDVLIFHTQSGNRYRMKHHQECCEQVWLEDKNGKFDDIVGDRILSAYKAEHQSVNDGCCTWTFFIIATIKHVLTLRWIGESNGYYSEDVEFEEITD